MREKHISLHEYLQQREEEKKERFRVDTHEKANWALRKIKALEEQKQENQQLAETEKAKIDEWLQMVNGQLDHSIQYYRGLLTEYAEELRQRDPTFKSVHLPNGRIGYRKQQPKWIIDEAVLINSLKQLGYEEYIQVKELVKKAELKKRFQVVGEKVIDPETGELIEGAKVLEQEDVLKIDPK